MAADFSALVVHTRSTKPLTIKQHMGRAIQQLHLDIVRRADPKLADELHREGHAPKPYAVSGLLRPNGTQSLIGELSTEAPTWFRLVGLRQDVSAALEQFAASPPDQVEIDRDVWRVECVSWDDSWAGRTSIAALIQSTMMAAPPAEFRLLTATPTAFHSDGLDSVLPTPNLVFGSLQNRWTSFSNLPLPESLNTYARWLLSVTRCRIETQAIKLKNGSLQTGFVGSATYSLETGNEQFQKSNPDAAREIRRSAGQMAGALRLLAAFAFFSGIGIKTTAGMGMCRFEVS